MSRTFLVFVLAAVAIAVTAAPASAQACGPTTREQFASAVDSGAADTELEATFGHCRNDGVQPTTVRQQPGLTAAVAEFKKVTNTGSVFYEQLNSCGYHPQAELVSCDVEVKQPFGFAGFPGGSTEYVLFCLDCNRDGIWDYTTLGSVHVTDDISGTPPSWFFEAHATTWAAPNLCVVNDGLVTDVRTILSWQLRPNGCNFIPIWGNQIDFTARRDP